jgi:hypothetical protein
VETKFFVEALGSILLSLIDIKNIPLLSFGTVVSPNLNCGSFTVIATLYIKYLLVLPIDELVVLILENLPPSRVCAPDSHAVGSSIVGDVEGLVVISGLDGQ